MAGRNSQNSAPQGGTQGEIDMLEKKVSENVLEMVSSASEAIKGKSYESIDAAIAAAGGDDPFFNPTLSQYRKGLVINTYKDNVKIKKAKVGNSSREAWVITCPAGYLGADGKPVYNAVFNFYPSTLRKQIQVTDEMGDAVLDENKAPVVLNGRGNEVWEAAAKCANSTELLGYALDKEMLVTEVLRDFGPAYFVEKAGSQKASGHKLTSLPFFKVIG